MKLYYAPNTRAIRPRWLLEEMQLPYELKHIDLFAGEGYSEDYLRIHPHGQVPALEANGQVVYESGAICSWLADSHPDTKLAPEPGNEKRAQYEQWMFYGPGTMEPPLWQILLHTLLLPEDQRLSSAVKMNEETFVKCIPVLNAALKGKDYILGDDFSVADIMIGSALIWGSNYISSINLDDYPNVQNYMQRLIERPAYQRALVN